MPGAMTGRSASRPFATTWTTTSRTPSGSPSGRRSAASGPPTTSSTATGTGAARTRTAHRSSCSTRLDRIASLGHEIGLHNNALSIALRTGLDPFAILERDLTALRRHGFTVTGSVAHGDKLCHTVGFVNNEIFRECIRPATYQPDRTLELADASGTTRRLQLRQRPMADFGLDYEANYIGHTRYLSDTGGRWSLPFSDGR